MAADESTIARPYAEAVFEHASETNNLERWTDTLEFLAALVNDSQVSAFLDDPKVDRGTIGTLLLDIGGDRLSQEAQNFLRLLVDGKRLQVLPEIARMYEELKRERQGTLDVLVVSAYAVNAVQQKKLAEALGKHFGREVVLTTEKDPALIGGIKIRAGDTVIDYSLQGQLTRLANELGI
jgi:F-type H+-transporting ATPase subunit delta